MRLEYQILLAVALDLLLGDPRWFPHPVKFIGRFALAVESLLRRAIPNPRLAGVAAVVTVVGGTALMVFLIVRGATLIHPFLGDIVSILLIYTSIAARDLVAHSARVYRSLHSGSLTEARRWVSWMVGRDT